MAEKYVVLKGSVGGLEMARNTMFIFLATTVVFVATTVYLIMRKPKRYSSESVEVTGNVYSST